MKVFVKQKVLFSLQIIICGGILSCSFFACVQKKSAKIPSEAIVDNQQMPDTNYLIGNTIYTMIAANSLQLFANFDYDAWGELLSDDVEYFFPNGNDVTRTKLTGKTNVLEWWKNWRATSGITSITITEENDVPVVALKTPNYAGLTGNWVFSWFNNDMVINGRNAGLRMNCTFHFNDENLIDRCYTYYDRTEIIQASEGKDILK